MCEYLVVTADMINSRHVSMEQMASIPEKLKKIDANLFSLSSSMLFAGDEIQLLFYHDNNHHPYSLLMNLIRHLEPFRFRFGFGIGAVDQPINQAIAQNKGQAFIQARKALDVTKKDRIIAWLLSEREQAQPEINSCFLLFNALTQKWTDKHWRRFLLYWEKQSIHKVAEIESVSPESINKFLKNASVRTILRSLDLFSESHKNVNHIG